MRTFKIVGLILAGLLAITSAAFAHGGGGGGFHGGGFGGGHFAGSHFGGSHYGWHGGYAGHYWHGGHWYGPGPRRIGSPQGHWYGGRWYGGWPYYGSRYPYGLGYYDYDNYDDPDSDAYYQTPNSVTTYSESTVVAVQKELAQLGYYHGSIDGIAGPETEKAIRWFQSTDKITVTGQIDDQTLKALQIS
jgi:hypothetical protein